MTSHDLILAWLEEHGIKSGDLEVINLWFGVLLIGPRNRPRQFEMWIYSDGEISIRSYNISRSKRWQILIYMTDPEFFNKLEDILGEHLVTCSSRT